MTEYVDHARECADLADSMRDGDPRRTLLEIAQLWLMLAEEARWAARLPNSGH